MERQLVVGLADVSALWFTCPGCHKEIVLSTDRLREWHKNGEESPCPMCQPNLGWNDSLKTKYTQAFRLMVSILCDLSDLRDFKVRMIVPEK